MSVNRMTKPEELRTVGILSDVASLIIDDALHEQGKFWIDSQERVVMRELQECEARSLTVKLI